MAHLSAAAQPARARAAISRFPAARPAGCTLPAGKSGLLPRPCLKPVACAPPAAAEVELQQPAAARLLPRPTHKPSHTAYLEDKYVKLCHFVETNSVVQIPEGKSHAEVALKLPKGPESPPVQQHSWWQLSFDEDYGLAVC